MSTTMLAAALTYANHRSWHVFPVPPNEKKSYKSAGHSNGAKWGMTKNAEQITRDFNRWPDAGVGVPTGIINNIFVLEADTAEGHDVDGIANLRELERQHGALPPTLMAVSPSGSLHYYFKHPGSGIKVKTDSNVVPGVDVRGDGGMVVAPPTIRHDGQYRWLNQLDIADPPQWLLDMVTRPEVVARELTDFGNGSLGAISEANPTLITAALAAVTDCTHKEWVAILSGVFKELGDEAGFEVIDAWASTNPKLYQGRDQVMSQWRPIVENGGYAYTIGSLFYFANRADPNWGWGDEAFRSVDDDEFAATMAEIAESQGNGRDPVTIPEPAATTDLGPSPSEGVSGPNDTPPSPPPPNDPEAMRLNEIRKQVAMLRVAEVEAKKVEWLWPQRIPMGKLTTIAGMPDVNKSTFTLYLAAQATTGGSWPCNEGTAPLGSVIILTAEDDIADTVRPRLEVAGADLSRIHVIKAVNIQGEGPRGFNLIADVFRLGLVLQHIGDVKMIIIDPISAYMGKPGGKFDSHRSTDVRATLAPLQELAARHKVAVVAIDHLNKSGGTTALLRVLNSIAFVAAARAVYFIMRDDDEADRRLLLAAKNNLGRIRTGLAFKVIEKLAPEPVFECYPAIKWEDEVVDMTADEALAARHDGRASEKLEEAKALLQQMLANGPAKQKDIEAKAKERNIGPKSLKNAKKALGVASSRADNAWWWQMPAQEPPM
jgi:hypothetical protein